MSSLVSPLEVYAVLQLDKVIDGMQVSLAVNTSLVVLLMLGCAIHASEDSGSYYNPRSEPVIAERKAMREKAYKVVKFCGFSAILSGVLATMLPSTKTAAAMFLLPAITSDTVTEPLTREAGELYQLAKTALAKAVESDVDAPKKEATDNDNHP